MSPAASSPVKPITPPMDRSNWPAMRGTVIPRAANASTASSLRIARRFSIVANESGRRSENTTMPSSSTSTEP